MTLSEIIAAAASAFKLFSKLKDAALAKGMTEAEFEDSMKKENVRLDMWYKKVISDLDKEWGSD